MNKDNSSINKDLKYEESGWAAQKVFWILIAIVLAYGLIGGLGDEAFFNKRHEKISSAIVEYKRYARVEKGYEMKIYLQDSVKDFSISLNSSYIDNVQITQVIPEPVNVKLINNDVIYKFNTLQGGVITFFLDPKKKGNITLELGVNGKRAVIPQFIFF